MDSNINCRASCLPVTWECWICTQLWWNDVIHFIWLEHWCEMKTQWRQCSETVNSMRTHLNGGSIILLFIVLHLIFIMKMNNFIGKWFNDSVVQIYIHNTLYLLALFIWIAWNYHFSPDNKTIAHRLMTGTFSSIFWINSIALCVRLSFVHWI